MQDLQTFDLNLLRVLAALLETGGVTRAARNLHLSQPAVSAALARLRQALGDQILLRRGSGMELTPFAEALRPKLARLLAEIGETLSAPGPFLPAKSDRVFRIAANDYASMVLVGGIAARLRELAPDATLEVLPLEERFKERLDADDYDLAVRDRWALQGAEILETLFTEEYLSIARTDHPRLGKRLTIAQFVSEHHVLVSPEGRVPGVVDHFLKVAGSARRVMLTLPHFVAAPAIVSATDLIATVAGRVAMQFARTYNLRIFRPPLALPSFDIAMAWRRRSQFDPAGQWLRDQVRAAARSLPSPLTKRRRQ